MKKTQNRIARIGLVVLANALILFFLVIGFGQEYVSNLQIEREIREREEERAQLVAQQTSTLALIDQLSSEYYLEKEGRIKQGLGKDGETLILVQPNAVAQPVTVQEGNLLNELAPDGIGNPLRWYYYFFDKTSFEELRAI